MLKFFSEKKRLFAFLAVILIVIVIPLTVIISRKQQVIRQRASGQQISLYFTNSENCNTPLTSINPTLGQSTSLSLCLRAITNYSAGISGFNITLSASNSLTFQSANTTADADKFGSEPPPQILNQNQAIRFTRILTSDNISDTPLRILDFTVLATTAENGSITIPAAEIVSLTQDELLTVENAALSYNSTSSSLTNTPAPIAGAPTATPTPGYTECTGRFYPDSSCTTGKEVGGFDTGCIQNNFYSTSTSCISGKPNSSYWTKPSCSSCSPSDPTPTPTPTPDSAFDTCAKTRSYCEINDIDGHYECSFDSVSCDEIKSFYTCSLGKKHIQTIGNYQDCLARTATPTPTPLPGSIQLDMNISAPRMIGNKTGENNSPLFRNNRPVTVILKSASGQTINKSGTLNYSQDTGSYTGTINLGTSVPPGAYKVTVKMGNHLKGFVSNLSVPPTTSTISLSLNANLVVGVDDDENLSPILYYNTLHSCFGTTIGIVKSKCSNPQETDLNSDGAVDGVDFNIFIRTLKEIIDK